MGAFLRKYNVLLVTGTTAIRVPIIKRGVVDFAASGDWTPAAGDVKVWVDGTPASITNLPTAVNSGNCTFWEFILTASELSCKQLIIVVTDSATKAVEDQGFIVETYGNASAMYAADYSAANLPADAVKIGGTAQTGRDLGTSVLLSAGTGTGQLDFTSGVVKSNLVQILGTLLTETAGQIAAGFKKFFNIATPASTMDHLVLVDTASSVTNAPPDSSGTTTLLSRLTPTRAGLLDNLDAAISSLNNLSALENFYVAPLLEIPDSGSSTYACLVMFRDNEGKLKDLDGSPTLTAVNAAGTDRSGNLSSVTHSSTGQYAFTYAVSSAAAEESLTLKASGTISAEARVAVKIVAIVNYDSITTLAAIKAKTDQLTFTASNKVDSNLVTIKTNPVVSVGTTTFQDGNVATSDDVGQIFDDTESIIDLVGSPAGGSVATAIAAVKSVADAVKIKTDNLPAAPASTTNITAASVTVSDKTGFKLAADGLDTITTTAPTGPAANFRQMVVQTWRRFFKKATLTASQAKTYADDDTTVITTQTVSNDGTTQVQGDAS